MSDGMTSMNWHFVTVWDALTFLTAEYIDPESWDVRVPRV